jgi:disulfide bond formation protein DsbB
MNNALSPAPLPPLALDTGWRGASAVAALLALVTALGVALSNDVVIGLALAGFFLAIIGALLGAIISWRARPLLRRLVSSAHFVCWQYSEAEWERHLAKSKRGLSMKMLTFYLATVILATIVIGGVIESAYRASVGMSAMNAADMVRFVMPMSIPIGVLLSFGAMYDAVTAWYRRAMQRDGRVACIGPDALYFAGQIADAHLHMGWKIQLAEADARCITFEHFGYRDHQRFDIPIPEGRENEARELLGKVRRSWRLNNA